VLGDSRRRKMEPLAVVTGPDKDGSRGWSELAGMKVTLRAWVAAAGDLLAAAAVVIGGECWRRAR
jgi:hypothetical protein